MPCSPFGNSHFSCHVQYLLHHYAMCAGTPAWVSYTSPISIVTAVVFKFAQLVAVYTAKTYSYKTHFTLSALCFILFLCLINFLENISTQPGAKPLCQAHYHNAEISGLTDGSDYSRQSCSRETHSPTFTHSISTQAHSCMCTHNPLTGAHAHAPRKWLISD